VAKTNRIPRRGNTNGLAHREEGQTPTLSVVLPVRSVYASTDTVSWSALFRVLDCEENGGDDDVCRPP